MTRYVINLVFQMVVSLMSQKKRRIKIIIEKSFWSKSTIFNEDRYLLNLMKKNHSKTSRQLASEWNLSHEKNDQYTNSASVHV